MSNLQDLTGLKLRFGGSLVEQLGAQLYPSATATVAELISNAWDADANNVWVTIPFGEKWQEESKIVVLDDGIGMTRDDAKNAYLIVGRKRRVETGKDVSEGGRKLHGRKGIGKLAAFGTAGILECATRRGGAFTAFRLDYEKIRKLDPDQDYDVEPAEDESPLLNPQTGVELTSGTRITLTRLWLKRALAEHQFRQSMSRRFAVAATEMRVAVNEEDLTRFSHPVQFRFPGDGQPDGVEVADGWAVETLEDGKQIRWWIGFTGKPIEEDYLRGVAVLARGKMAQRPFFFERSQGTEGQLGQEYLLGEVEADWIDDGLDIEDDLIQSNRDQLQLEDRRLGPLITWGRGCIGWALRERNELKRELAYSEFEQAVAVEDLFAEYTVRERRQLMGVAQTLSRLPEMNPSDVRGMMVEVINARSDVVVRQMMERIAEEEEPFQERMWALVHEFGLIDARRNLTIIQARLDTIGKLKKAIEGGAKEVPEIHNVVKRDTWLLDPRWHLLDDEVDIATLGVDFNPEYDSETGQQLDYLFALQPRPPAKIDEVVVVEIKRGTLKSGSVRKATVDEVDKFHNYVLAVQSHYQASTERPSVRGLMITQAYTQQAAMKRKSLETTQDVRLEFRTWDRVIEDTERMHLGWLALSKRRVDESSAEEADDAVSSSA